MKFKVVYSSGKPGFEKEINTLEELIEYRKEFGSDDDIILCTDKHGEVYLELYDAYRE